MKSLYPKIGLVTGLILSPGKSKSSKLPNSISRVQYSEYENNFDDPQRWNRVSLHAESRKNHRKNWSCLKSLPVKLQPLRYFVIGIIVLTFFSIFLMNSLSPLITAKSYESNRGDSVYYSSKPIKMTPVTSIQSYYHRLLHSHVTFNKRSDDHNSRLSDKDNSLDKIKTMDQPFTKNMEDDYGANKYYDSLNSKNNKQKLMNIFLSEDNVAASLPRVRLFRGKRSGSQRRMPYRKRVAVPEKYD